MHEYKPEDFLPCCRITDDLYFVGTVNDSAGSHLIDTGDGLILIDSGFPDLLDRLLDNIRGFGFDPKDIKILLISHGHYDHLGNSVRLRERYGTKLYLGRRDRAFANGEGELTAAKELGYEYTDPFDPDVLLDDGNEVKLGHTTVKCYSTPGHTPGTMTYVFNTSFRNKEYVSAMFGGIGINQLKISFLDRYGLPHSLRDEFRASLNRMKDLHVDIAIGNHPSNVGTLRKAKQLLADPNGDNPFIDSSYWKTMIERNEKAFEEMIANGE